MKFIKASKLFVLIIILYNISLFAQSVSIGTLIGGGVISSNSPQIGSFSTEFFIEGGLTDEDYIGYRLSLIYAADFSSLLPGDRSEYYPFIKGASLKFIHSFDLTNTLFFEQGFGLTAINDHIFSDRNEWGYGLVVSLTAGKDLRLQNYSGIKLGIGTQYGLVFLNYSANYLSFFFQVQYSI